MNSLEISTGEAILFWVLGPLSVLGALSLLFAKRVVHIAVSIVGVMIALAVLYIAQEAPFLGIAQIVVYTGAVMMLFLFVIMLVGVESSESLVETIKGQRFIAVVGGLGLVALLISIVTTSVFHDPVGLKVANTDTNPVGVARIIFGDYLFPFELTAALLITAALGALVLSHKRRIGPQRTHKDVVEEKLRALSGPGGHQAISAAPGPGVYARNNSADMPALAADGTALTESVSTVLRIRGQVHDQADAHEAASRVALIASGAPVIEDRSQKAASEPNGTVGGASAAAIEPNTESGEER